MPQAIPTSIGPALQAPSAADTQLVINALGHESPWGKLADLVGQYGRGRADQRANAIQDAFRNALANGLSVDDATKQVAGNPIWSDDDRKNANLNDLIAKAKGDKRDQDRLGLEKDRVGLEGQKLKLAANADARAARLMLQKEEADRLVAEFTEFTDGTPEAARVFLDRNKTRLMANPLAYNLVTQAAKQGGMSMAAYSQDDPNKIGIPTAKDLQGQLDASNVALRTLAATGNIEQLLDDKGNLLSENSEKVLKGMIDQYSYKGGDAENFSDNFWKAYNKVKAANPFLSDAMIAGILKRNVESRGWTGFWRVNDWDVGLFNNILEETAKKIGNPNETIAKYSRMLTQRDRLQELLSKDMVTNIAALLADKEKRVKANIAAGRLTEQEGEAIIRRARAAAASQFAIPGELISNALLDSASVVTNEKDKTKTKDKK